MALDERELGTVTAPTRASSETTRALIQETIESVRALAVDLRPKALDDFGLAPALESLATSFTGRTGIAVDLDPQTGDARLPPVTELTVYRLVQEVLTHVQQLDRGGSARVTIRRRPADVRVVVEHDRCDASGRSPAGRPSSPASESAFGSSAATSPHDPRPGAHRCARSSHSSEPDSPRPLCADGVQEGIRSVIALD